MTQTFSQALSRQDKVASWLQSSVGMLLLEAERAPLEKVLAPLFGSYLLHYSPCTAELPKPANLRYTLRLTPAGGGGDILCAEGAWPIEPYGMDAVVLQHALDFAQNPHQLLREAALSVRAGGHLVIVGINPWSSWGLTHLWARDGLGEAHCLSAKRVQDWLKLLGFALEKRELGCYRPPLASLGWQQRLERCEPFAQRRQLPGAGFYLLVARKLMLGARPPRPSVRQPLGVLLPAPAVKLSARTVEEHSGN